MNPAVLASPSLAVLSAVFVLWLLSVRIRDVSIADIWWGPGFAVIAWAAAMENSYLTQRELLAAGLLSLWGFRLGSYLWLRNHGQEEDHRYQAMRGDSPHFWWVSLFQVFLLQGGLQLLVALPVYAVAASEAPLHALDVAGCAVALAGIAVEGLADLQLTAFKKVPENAGKVMRRGLWGWSRHPNYFGNALIWLGMGMLAHSAGGPVWAWAGPAVMWFLLLRVSGVAMLERTIAKRRPDYQAYIEEVSPFIPLPPKRRTKQERG